VLTQSQHRKTTGIRTLVLRDVHVHPLQLKSLIRWPRRLTHFRVLDGKLAHGGDSEQLSPDSLTQTFGGIASGVKSLRLGWFPTSSQGPCCTRYGLIDLRTFSGLEEVTLPASIVSALETEQAVEYLLTPRLKKLIFNFNEDSTMRKSTARKFHLGIPILGWIRGFVGELVKLAHWAQLPLKRIHIEYRPRLEDLGLPCWLPRADTTVLSYPWDILEKVKSLGRMCGIAVRYTPSAFTREDFLEARNQVSEKLLWHLLGQEQRYEKLLGQLETGSIDPYSVNLEECSGPSCPFTGACVPASKFCETRSCRAFGMCGELRGCCILGTCDGTGPDHEPCPNEILLEAIQEAKTRKMQELINLEMSNNSGASDNLVVQV
jgi:hypothetical protein